MDYTSSAHHPPCLQFCTYSWEIWFHRPVVNSLQWRHKGHDGVSNHQPRRCLLNHLFRCRSKKTSKLRVTGLCAGNSPRTGEFPAKMTSNAENVSHLMTSSCVMIQVVKLNCRQQSFSLATFDRASRSRLIKAGPCVTIVDVRYIFHIWKL